MIRCFLLLLSLTSSLLHAQQASLEVSLGSDMAVTREAVLIQLTVKHAEAYGWPQPPKAPPLTFKQGERGYRVENGRQYLAFTYAVYSYRPGIFRIPPFQIRTNRGALQSKPLTLRIFDESKLVEGVAEVGRSQIPYFTGVFFSMDKPYVGEEQKVVLKLFVPNQIRIQEPQLAEMETKNLAAWRFESLEEWGSYERDGKKYQAITYTSTISALKEGPAQLGPGKVEPVIQGTIVRRGRTYWQQMNVLFTLPKMIIEARPLPSPVPEGFNGAVGNFKITAVPTAQTLELGESLTVDLSVTGSGNLETLQPPQLQGSDKDWKSFDAIRLAQGSERRKSGGTVNFNQVLRPLKIVPELPPYHLVFFDPVLEEYRTAKSAGYPLVVTGSLSQDTSGSLPLVALAPGTMKSVQASRPWLWQIIPAGLTFTALALWLTSLFQRRTMADLPVREFESDLSKVKAAASKSRPEFFRAVGHFLEQWPHEEIEEDAHQWIQTRDEICFSPDGKEEAVLPKEREKILSILKRCTPIILSAIALIPTPVDATIEEHWTAGEFDKGAEILRHKIAENPTPSAYYNLGLFEKKREHQGIAALCLYRALASDPSLDSEPLTDLTTRSGALTRRERTEDDWLAKFPRTTYRELFFLGIWLIILIFVVKALLRKPKWKKHLTLSFMILSPIAVLSGGLGWWYYPKEMTYRPLLEASIVMSDQALRRSPHSEGESYREIPAGSLGYVTAERGNWSFVEFARELTGWLPKETLKPVAGNEL